MTEILKTVEDFIIRTAADINHPQLVEAFRTLDRVVKEKGIPREIITMTHVHDIRKTTPTGKVIAARIDFFGDGEIGEKLANYLLAEGIETDMQRIDNEDGGIPYQNHESILKITDLFSSVNGKFPAD